LTPRPSQRSKTAADGLLAALLAEQGFDTDADAFEHLQGFLKVDVERLFASWTAPLEIEAALGSNSATLEKQAFCHLVHQAWSFQPNERGQPRRFG
jgi:2-methylcitrate dehydratase PrpD